MLFHADPPLIPSNWNADCADIRSSKKEARVRGLELADGADLDRECLGLDPGTPSDRSTVRCAGGPWVEATVLEVYDLHLDLVDLLAQLLEVDAVAVAVATDLLVDEPQDVPGAVVVTSMTTIRATVVV